MTRNTPPRKERAVPKRERETAEELSERLRRSARPASVAEIRFVEQRLGQMNFFPRGKSTYVR